MDTLENTLEAKPGADACEQTSAAELIEILRQQGFTTLVTLLEEGQPLTPRQIARRLRISTAKAGEMLDKARALLIRHGIELPPMTDRPGPPEELQPKPAKPARKGKPKTKLAKKKSKPAARFARAVMIKGQSVEPTVRPLRPLRPLHGSFGSSRLHTLAMMAELLMLGARREPEQAADILTRYGSLAYSTTPEPTETRSRAGST